jgi:hypothetical protein
MGPKHAPWHGFQGFWGFQLGTHREDHKATVVITVVIVPHVTRDPDMLGNCHTIGHQLMLCTLGFLNCEPSEVNPQLASMRCRLWK